MKVTMKRLKSALNKIDAKILFNDSGRAYILSKTNKEVYLGIDSNTEYAKSLYYEYSYGRDSFFKKLSHVIEYLQEA